MPPQQRDGLLDLFGQGFGFSGHGGGQSAMTEGEPAVGLNRAIL
jgi:hypothetical protein